MKRKSFTIYTGYFGQIKKYHNPISIANTDPSWFIGDRCEELAPGDWLWEWKRRAQKWNSKEEHDILKKEYIERYNEQLKKLFKSSQDLKMFLMKKFPTKEIITLCCYERAPIHMFNSLEINKDFCHRHIITEWIKGWGFCGGEYKPWN